MDDNVVFGQVVKSIRISKSLSQETLAHKTGLDRTYISLIETGKKSPTLATIVKISNVLEISTSALFLKFEEEKARNEGEQ